MAGKTTIEWTAMPGYAPAVWNPTTGCTRVSAGCDNCYAFALHDKRYAINAKAAYAAVDPGPVRTAGSRIARARRAGFKLPWPKQYDEPFSHVQLLPERLDAPLRTRKPTCYFVDSMADLFHEEVPVEFIDRVWGTMENQLAAQHRFLILTKRPERMHAYLSGRESYMQSLSEGTYTRPGNVWLGTSVEDQRAADERIPHLLATPAAVRFLSCEPLLGPIDLAKTMRDTGNCTHDGKLGLDWVIVGGESGPRARPMDLAWARSLRDQCAAAGVSFFCKQLGAEAYDATPDPLFGCRICPSPIGARHVHVAMRESHGRDPDEWPADLRVRTWPQ